jgi:putative ABC transport system permease protein
MGRRKRMMEDLDQDIRDFLERETQHNIERGMTPEEARYAALRKFGNVTRVREETWEVWSLVWLEQLWQDVRFGLRQLRRNPGFTAVAVATLAIGIGANTAVFSVGDALLFHPLPYVPDAGRVVTISQWAGYWGSSAPANFVDWEAQSRSFSSMASWEDRSVTLGESRGPMPLNAAFVSRNFFKTLGVSPALGREFFPEEEESGRRAVILTYRLWESLYGGSTGVIGGKLTLDDAPYTIVGVMPKEFDFSGSDLLAPLEWNGAVRADRLHALLHVFARLGPGASLSGARVEMRTIARRLQLAYPETDGRVEAIVAPLQNFLNGNLMPVFIFTMMGAVGFVLLIACANTAGLQIARATGRRREAALRAALGASRWRVFRQLMTESLLIALLGAGAGLLLAEWYLHLLVATTPAALSTLITGFGRIGLNLHVLIFMVAITALAGILSGLAPAFQTSEAKLQETLKGGVTTSHGSESHRLRSILVGAQIGVAMILLVGAGLMVEGFRNSLATARSFGPTTLLTMRVNLPDKHFSNGQQKVAFYDQALERLAAMPAVQSVCLLTTLPFSNNGTEWERFVVKGQPVPHSLPGAVVQAISPGMFAALHVPLLQGRDFSANDGPQSTPVAVVSGKLARSYWPDGDAVGKQLQLRSHQAEGPWLTVVGVAGDVEYDWTDNAPEPVIYLPYRQKPMTGSFFALRTSVGPAGVVGPIRHELAQVSPDVPVSDIRTLDRALYESTAGLVQMGGTLTVLGVIGVILAAVGLYGMMTFSISQRTNEIGIRMALGATRKEILKRFMGEGALLIAISATIGLACARILTPLLASFFYGVGVTDPTTFVVAPLVLSAVALVAIYIPTRRATKVDPMIALRYE